MAGRSSELGATEFVFCAAGSDKSTSWSSPTPIRTFYLQKAATWAGTPISPGPNDAADTLNLYATSAAWRILSYIAPSCLLETRSRTRNLGGSSARRSKEAIRQGSNASWQQILLDSDSPGVPTTQLPTAAAWCGDGQRVRLSLTSVPRPTPLTEVAGRPTCSERTHGARP